MDDVESQDLMTVGGNQRGHHPARQLRRVAGAADSEITVQQQSLGQSDD